MSEPTEEQIYRLQELEVMLRHSGGLLQPSDAVALRALLSAYEERGLEVERLRAELAHKVSDCENCEEAYARSFSAEARLAKVVEIITPKYDPLREVEDDDACVECGEWFKRRGDGSLCDPCAQELLSLVLAAVQPEAKPKRER